MGSIVTNKSYWQYFKSLQFNEKCLMILYFFALVPCSIKLLMGINTRIGLSVINPVLDIVIFITFTVLSFRVFVRELKWWDVALVIGIGWFVFWSPNIYPQTYLAVLEFAPYFVFGCLPFYLIGASINLTRYERMFRCIGRWGLIVNIFICVLAILGLAQKLFGNENNMELAYGVLPSVILVARNLMRNNNRVDLTLTIIGAFLILSLGCRGALLALVLYIAGDLFLFKEFKNAMAARVKIIIATTFCYLMAEPLLLIMESITSSLGFGTRVYNKLLGGDIVNTDTRNWIYDLVSDYITYDKEHIGYGFFYDRVLMGMDASSYAHNIIYELMLNFGFYIGGALFILIISILVFDIFKTRQTETSSLLLAFFCFCFVSLFFSSSYLCNKSFWLFIGLIVTTFFKVRKSHFIK